MVAMSLTPVQTLIDAALGGRGRLRAYVEVRRGENRTWRQVADDLQRDHEIVVSYETLRLWHPDLARPTAARGASRARHTLNPTGKAG